jgi:endo-beta-N-acetylglucosaminidase D
MIQDAGDRDMIWAVARPARSMVRDIQSVAKNLSAASGGNLTWLKMAGCPRTGLSGSGESNPRVLKQKLPVCGRAQFPVHESHVLLTEAQVPTLIHREEPPAVSPSRPLAPDARRVWPLDRRAFLTLSAALLADVTAPAQGAARPAEADRPASLAPNFPLTHPSRDSFTELMAYDPARDPDAPFFRSFTPRAARIAPFAATQAHPRLDPRPRVASLSTCYSTLAPQRADENFHKERYGTPPQGGVYVSRVFTYHDILVQWSGTGQIPNPAMTDVAHRNGAYCFGTIFQPDHRVYDSSTVPARTVAAKYVKLAEYFGFDGYFFNFESGTPEANAQVLALIGMMRDEARRRGLRDFQVQFYDGHTNIDGLLPVQGSAGNSWATSTMLDQGWSAYGGPGNCCSGEPVQPAEVFRYCNEHSFNPFADAYFGLQLYPGPGYLDAVAPEVIHPNDGAYAWGSLQLYSVEDGLQNQLRADQPSLPVDRIQAELYALERRFFSGKSQNPALDNDPDAAEALAYLPNKQVAESRPGEKPVERSYHFYTDRSAVDPKPTDQTNLPLSWGVANFIVEHSVIGAFPFLTRFNVGEGRRFFVDGEPVSDEPWFNLGIQDLLPTWQWWVEPIAGTPAWHAAGAAQKLSADYDQTRAFHGGASLRLRGRLEPGEAAQIRLYKAALTIPSDADAQLQLVTAGSAPLELGLLFADAPQMPEWFSLHDAQGKQEPTGAGWTRSTVPMRRFSGRTIAAILLGFRSGPQSATVVDTYIGELYLGLPAPGSAPPAPEEFVVEAHGAGVKLGTIEARLRWKRPPQSAGRCVRYDVFCLTDRRRNGVWLGGVDAEAFYVGAVPVGADGSVTFELTATYSDAPLSPSGAARAVLRT